MAAAFAHPRVGIAAIIPNAEGKLLLGKRRNSHGSGTWQFPGGHLEFGETYFACAEREVAEETALKAQAVRLVGVTNDVFKDLGKHYVTLFVLCRTLEPAAEPELLEPDKCEGWYWVEWDEVRAWCEHHDDADPRWEDKKCFLPIRNLVAEQPDIKFSS
ncbi:hypothetical protein DL764_003397 [Monosporascus ibericus]|uniref:Nudix hydrolase domain-containing protein n=1 Tax=Monosporascus ibericus TaxID=155417 RepID=A0A4Q4TJ75_9PEZI|nr:hypothetical protein DL764_003397 [Monosporascus ibericus]